MGSTLSDAKNAIELLDMNNIVKKLVLSGWKLEQAKEAIKQYKNLLFLWRKHGSHQSLPPSIDIDEVWHFHILDTQKYQADCQEIFGRYLHHYPYFGIDEQSDEHDLNHAFEETKRLYQEEFGEALTCVRLDLKSLIKRVLRRRAHRKGITKLRLASYL